MPGDDNVGPDPKPGGHRPEIQFASHEPTTTGADADHVEPFSPVERNAVALIERHDAGVDLRHVRRGAMHQRLDPTMTRGEVWRQFQRPHAQRPSIIVERQARYQA
jgi:hypothetical protein